MRKLMLQLWAIILLTFLNQGLVFLAVAVEYEPVNVIEHRHFEVEHHVLAPPFMRCEK
ncbi:hypothetical protein ZIOFF_072561 [Zingiber officinale]|uniref:Uncharacterized protein n=1 Tax=Zingiber officinale TaxID=94328 RepID=A0A8J5C626_ZINOF|nr:hypothetical protein ZIOFF_072561 [Zingiber officinale]